MPLLPEEGKGRVQITIAEAEEAERTLLPNASKLTYKITITKDKQIILNELINKNIWIGDLEPGSYAVEVICYNTESSQLVSKGSAILTVAVKEIKSISITLQTAYTGEGVFSYAVNFANDVTFTDGYLQIISIPANIEYKNIILNNNNLSDSINSVSGYYKINLCLENIIEGKVYKYEKTDAMHIADGLVTNAVFDITKNDFSQRNIIEDMVRINAGSFVSNGNTITVNGFYIGKYEVTQSQYQTVMGINPSGFSTNPAIGEVQRKRPVENVTWLDAIEFCNKLSELEGLAPVYKITNRNPAAGYPINYVTVTADWNNNGYKLPTESQWEYACRAGTTTDWCFGNSESELAKYAWYSANSESMTHQVGIKLPNAWGLYDMHGNVWEWCWFEYPLGTISNTGLSNDDFCVRRGGGWFHPAPTSISSYSFIERPGDRGDVVGFRVARQDTYTVNFDSNGGNGITPIAQTLCEGSTIILPENNGLTKTGYAFVGWIEDGTGTNYLAGTSYTVNRDVTFYARWIAVYTVTFDSNGATSGAAPAAQTVNGGSISIITLPDGNDLIKTGFTFGGWNTRADGTGTNYNIGASYTVSVDVTLYARWLNFYTIKFNANGATSGTAPAAQTVGDGSIITLPDGNDLIKTGFAFGGWNTIADGTGTNYNIGASYTVRGDVTLYARWLISYIITFNANGATSGTAPAAQTVGDGTTIILPNGSSFTKTGFAFNGWNTIADGTGTNYLAGTSFTVNGDITLYARWIHNNHANWNWTTYTSGSGLRECQTAGCTGKAGVGDRGPAGGIIIYAVASVFTVTGTETFTANYLEAAPVNQGTSLAWALSTSPPGSPPVQILITGAQGTAIGTGKANTAAILAVEKNAPAAEACKDYNGGGKTDWFLPSRDELNEMYNARTHLGISSGKFWSSSQYDYGYVWYQNFDYGSQNNWGKTDNYNVRAVRAF